MVLIGNPPIILGFFTEEDSK